MNPPRRRGRQESVQAHGPTSHTANRASRIRQMHTGDTGGREVQDSSHTRVRGCRSRRRGYRAHQYRPSCDTSRDYQGNHLGAARHEVRSIEQNFGIFSSTFTFFLQSKDLQLCTFLHEWWFLVDEEGGGERQLLFPCSRQPEVN